MMQYEAIVEKFTRCEGTELCIEIFEAESDVEAILKAAAKNGSLSSEAGKDVTKISEDRALELLNDSQASDSANILHRLANKTTGAIIYDQTSGAFNQTEEYDEAFQEWLDDEE